MLGLAEAGQVGVDGRDQRASVTEIDLDLAEVLALFEQVGCVRMTQRVNVRGLFDAAGLEREAEGALERGAAHGFSGRGGALSTVTLGGKEQRGVPMRFPLFPQELERAFGQRDVTILITFAGADMEEHAFGIDVAHLQPQAFSQTQAAGVKGDQANAMIQGGNLGQNAPHFGSGEHHGEFELGIGANQLQFVGPDPFEGFLPEEFESADNLSARLAGDFLLTLEMDAILAKLFGADEVGGFVVELAELADAGVIGLFGARADGLKSQIIGE